MRAFYAFRADPSPVFFFPLMIARKIKESCQASLDIAIRGALNSEANGHPFVSQPQFHDSSGTSRNQNEPTALHVSRAPGVLPGMSQASYCSTWSPGELISFRTTTALVGGSQTFETGSGQPLVCDRNQTPCNTPLRPGTVGFTARHWGSRGFLSVCQWIWNWNIVLHDVSVSV